MRVGLGYDSHRFDPSRPLILGGIEIPGSPGLSGHSDGDAVAHAIIDAILGAVGAGDVGRHFPPGEAEWEGADSMNLLQRAGTLGASPPQREADLRAIGIALRPRGGDRNGR